MTMTEAKTEPMMPSDLELDALTKAHVIEVIESHGLPAPKGATRAELVPWARSVVHGARARAEREAEGEKPDDEPVVEAAAAEAEVGVELELAPKHLLPEASKWNQIVEMSNYLARSSLCPKALRDHPNDVALVLLAGHDLGIALTQALQKIVVVDGKLTMMGELMSAVILRDGHKLKADPANDHLKAVVHGKRRDDDEWISADFTIDDAVRAGLCTVDDQGNARARASTGKKLAWETYTGDMLYWRALSRLARRHFGDCLGGVSYTPDEIGYIDADSFDRPPAHEQPKGRAGETEPTMTIGQMRDGIAARIASIDDPDLRRELHAEWKKRNLPRVQQMTPAAIKTAVALLEPIEAKAAALDAARTADLDEAVTVCPADGCEVETEGGVLCAEHRGSGDPDPEDSDEFFGPTPIGRGATDEDPGIRHADGPTAAAGGPGGVSVPPEPADGRTEGSPGMIGSCGHVLDGDAIETPEGMICGSCAEKPL